MDGARFQSKHINIAPKLVSSKSTEEAYTLSEEQRRFYNDFGYLVIKGLIDSETLDVCRQRFKDICEGKVDKGHVTVMKELSLINSGLTGEDLIYKIQDILFDDVLSRYTEHPRLLSVVSALIGPNVTGVHSMLLNKPPNSALHPPHQDLHYFPFRPAARILAAWTALDAATVANGCLFVEPGSHTGALLEHGYPKSGSAENKMFHGVLDSRACPPSRRVALPMAAGDTVFFHPLLLHGSGANVSRVCRKALSCHYAASECEYIDVTGTSQQNIAEEVVAVAAKRGIEGVTFVDTWKYRSKLVKGVKCNL